MEQNQLLENEFSEDIGDVFLGKTNNKGNFDYNSPDSTTEVRLKKTLEDRGWKTLLVQVGK